MLKPTIVCSVFTEQNVLLCKFLKILIDKKHIELIEDLTLYHIEVFRLPPLTAKVFAYLLVVQPNDGLSFGEMVDIFKVSKSSVSNSLNQLMQYGYIIQYNKVGERKRRYKVTSQYLEIRLRKIKENLLREKYLTDKIIQCDCGKENISDRFNYAKVDVYLNHLNITIDNLTSTIDKLDKITHSI